MDTKKVFLKLADAAKSAAAGYEKAIKKADNWRYGAFFKPITRDGEDAFEVVQNELDECCRDYERLADKLKELLAFWVNFEEG